MAEITQLLPSPPHLGSYTRTLLVSQDRRHLFVTPCKKHTMIDLRGVSANWFKNQLFPSVLGFQDCGLCVYARYIIYANAAPSWIWLMFARLLMRSSGRTNTPTIIQQTRTNDAKPIGEYTVRTCKQHLYFHTLLCLHTAEQYRAGHRSFRFVCL